MFFRKKKIVVSAQNNNDLKGILIEDEDLKKEATDEGIARNSNYVVLGDIDLEESEKKFLEIHYKCRERQKVNRLDLEIEINKLQTKHRYEKMSHDDDLENLPDDELVAALTLL